MAGWVKLARSLVECIGELTQGPGARFGARDRGQAPVRRGLLAQTSGDVASAQFSAGVLFEVQRVCSFGKRELNAVSQPRGAYTTMARDTPLYQPGG